MMDSVNGKLLAFLCLPLVLGTGACTDGGGPNAKGAAKYTIAVVPMSSVHEFWNSIRAGAIKAARERNVDIVWKAPQANEREPQIALLENLVVRAVNGIVLAPVDAVALVPAVEAAVGKGIPVVIIDSALNSDRQISFVATDNYNGGVAGGHHLAKLLGGDGKVIMLRANEGVSSTMKRESGFLDAIKEYPKIEVVSSNQRAGVTMELAYEKSQQLLAKFKSEDGGLVVDGIFTSCEPVSHGMMRAMEEGKFTGKVKYVGFDASPKLVEGLRKGHIDGLVVQDPMRMGYLGVKAVVDHLEGREVTPHVDTGSTIITPENVNDPQNRNLVEPDLDRWLNSP